MSVEFMQDGRLPVVPPIMLGSERARRTILLSRAGTVGVDVFYCALTYGWNGWTDGALWLIHHIPSNQGRRLILRFVDITMTRSQMTEYYRRYTYVGSMPALYYRTMYLYLPNGKEEGVVLSDPYRSILILRKHFRLMFHAMPETFTLWIHPYLNCYTITIQDSTVGFGFGVPFEMMKTPKYVRSVLRKGTLQIRRWWESRIQKTYMEHRNPDALFGWRY